MEWNRTDFDPISPLSLKFASSAPSAVLSIAVNYETGNVFFSGCFTDGNTLNNVMMLKNTNSSWNNLGTGLNFVSSAITFDSKFENLFIASSYFLFPNYASNVSFFAILHISNLSWEFPYVGIRASYVIVPYKNNSKGTNGKVDAIVVDSCQKNTTFVGGISENEKFLKNSF